MANTCNAPLQSDNLRTILNTAHDLTGLYVHGYCPRESCAWRWQSRPAELYADERPVAIRCGRCKHRLKHYSLSSRPILG